MFIPVFALNKGSLLYQEADFEIISAARPQIAICTKNLPGIAGNSWRGVCNIEAYWDMQL